MTSPEVQQAAFLDLLFENRNKLYGAYTLRKFYNQRLAMALCLSVLLVASVLSIILNNIAESGKPIFKDIPDDVFVHTHIIPELPKPPIPAAPSNPKPPTINVAQQQYTQVHITTDPVTITDVPTQADLNGVAISNTTTTGAPEPAIPIVTNSTTGTRTEKQPHSTALNAEPQFPGGAAAWAGFLSRNLQAPETLEAGEKKTVLVKFLVNEDGAVTGFDVMQSGGAAFDAEVIRVLKKMPRWKPALKNGVPAAVSFTQPVTFIASGE